MIFTVANTFNYIRAVGLLINYFSYEKNGSLWNMTCIIMINKIGYPLQFINQMNTALSFNYLITVGLNLKG